MEKTVGFVMMIDVSGSMYDAIDMVKIDCKAFLRQALPMDQFGVNQFHQQASWVYPSGEDPDIVTVSPFKAETQEAANRVENIVSGGNTNIGAAIQLSNPMIGKSVSDINAFVLFSDGSHNTGPAPDTILGNTPPIYVAALGYWMKESYFKKMLAKNSKSRFYQKPNASDVMVMFNDIRAESSESLLAANEFDTYPKGSDYVIKDFCVPGDSSHMQLSVVWTNKKYQYTDGPPKENFLNVILVDPAGKSTDLKPDIADGGYCIFDLDKLYPGNWKCLVQYARITDNMGATFGAISLDTAIKVKVDAPSTGRAGEPLTIGISANSEGSEINDMSITARLSKPLISVENAIRKYSNELKGIVVTPHHDDSDPEIMKLMQYRKMNLACYDIMEREYRNVFVPMSKDGSYGYTLKDTHESGIYTVEFKIEGTDPSSGGRFIHRKEQSIIIE